MVFITATDGNHGKGVAFAASKLGCKSIVLMPKGSVEVRAEAIRQVGAYEVTITDLNYDDAVRKAAKMANENNWYLVQDTAWDGYVTARGMRLMASPIGDDTKIISGESGAVGLGLLSLLMERNEFKSIRKTMNLNSDSIVLIFSTEGNTDPIGYNEIIYDGKNPSPFIEGR